MAKYCGRAVEKVGCQYKKHLEKTRRAFRKHYWLFHDECRQRIKMQRRAKFGIRFNPEYQNDKGQFKKGTSMNKGKPLSENTKKNISKVRIEKGVAKGERNPNWRGGVTPLHRAVRTSIKYKEWRLSVFKRDNYMCVLCKTKKTPLNADHIKQFAYFPDLRFDINNGRTLCEDCHKKTDTYAGRGRRCV